MSLAEAGRVRARRVARGDASKAPSADAPAPAPHSHSPVVRPVWKSITAAPVLERIGATTLPAPILLLRVLVACLEADAAVCAADRGAARRLYRALLRGYGGTMADTTASRAIELFSAQGLTHASEGFRWGAAVGGRATLHELVCGVERGSGSQWSTGGRVGLDRAKLASSVAWLPMVYGIGTSAGTGASDPAAGAAGEAMVDGSGEENMDDLEGGSSEYVDEGDDEEDGVYVLGPSGGQSRRICFLLIPAPPRSRVRQTCRRRR